MLLLFISHFLQKSLKTSIDQAINSINLLKPEGPRWSLTPDIQVHIRDSARFCVLGVL